MPVDNPCFKIHFPKLVPADQQLIRSATQDYIKRGMSAKDAAARAVQDKMDDLENQRKQIHTQLLKEVQEQYPEVYESLKQKHQPAPTAAKPTKTKPVIKPAPEEKPEKPPKPVKHAKSEYPVAINPEGQEHTIIGWANSIRMGGWEWWGFKKSGDIWEGYVEGYENEYGSWSEKELAEQGIKMVTDPKELLTIAPPVDWKWKDQPELRKPEPEEVEATVETETELTAPTAPPPGMKNFHALAEGISKEIGKGNVLNKPALEKMARSFGIEDPRIAKEAAEYAVISLARDIVQAGGSQSSTLVDLIRVYKNQPNLTARSSTIVDLQQYSTPVPLAYIMQIYTGSDQGTSTYEPTAGNGMLVFAGDPKRTIVNEIDLLRNWILQQQGFDVVTALDASQPVGDFSVQSIQMNPPFGGVPGDKKFVTYDGFKIGKLEHLISLRALEHMADDGKAAIIIGGHNEYDENGKLQNDRVFFNYLNQNYYVADVINIDGDLYQKQGSKFPIRMILIEGRRPERDEHALAATADADRDRVVGSFEDVYDRMMEVYNETVVRPDGDEGSGRGGIRANDTRRPAKGSGGPRGVSPGQAGTSGVPSGGPRGSGEPDLGPSGTGVGGGGGVAGETEGEGDTGVLPDEEPDSRYPTPDAAAGQGKTESVDQGPGARTVRRNDALESFGKHNLNVPYQPQSKSGYMGAVVPTGMANDHFKALEKFEDRNGPIDHYVQTNLKYPTTEAVHEALGAEQIDAVGLAIEKLKEGRALIVGDQAGLGKGRVAISIVRYAINQGKKPILITQKKHLFSDFYRDMVGTGSDKLRPLIINDDGRMENEQGDVIYSPPNKAEFNRILESQDMKNYDFVVLTYSQINSERAKRKRIFLSNQAEGNIVVMDESHTASGDSNTGKFIGGLVHSAEGVVYLSGTFAKRPDNLFVYLPKTSISNVTMTPAEIIDAIKRGGPALQEVLSADLVEAGEMIRRERTFDGVKIDYETLDNLKEQHRKTSDAITDVIRDIIKFQANFVTPHVNSLEPAEVEAATGNVVDSIAIQRGTKEMGIDNAAFASKIHNVVGQMLFAIKADAIADKAMEMLKPSDDYPQGRKPVIMFSNTMESFFNDMGYKPGDEVKNADFATSLERGLRNVMKISITHPSGEKTSDWIKPEELGPLAKKEYDRIMKKIKDSTTGIPISPIDHIIEKIENESLQKVGRKITMAEVTGRQGRVVTKAGKKYYEARIERNVTHIFRKFNNGEYDGMMLNASGSTGTSAHTDPKFKDQRPRVGIIHQIELNIDNEVQKRFRIHRTGQTKLPSYVYLFSSIPAEQRLLMVFKKKMASLDANTTSSQKSAQTLGDIEDFINKYGDKIVTEYILENPDFNERLGDRFHFSELSDEELSKIDVIEDAATKVTGRVAMLPVAEQEVFYNEIAQRYKDLIAYLETAGQNDLTVKTLPLDAVTLKTSTAVVGRGGDNPFSRDTVVEENEVNILTKPMLKKAVDEMIEQAKEKAKTQSVEKIAGDFERFVKEYRKKQLAQHPGMEKWQNKVEGHIRQWEQTMESLFGLFKVGSKYPIPYREMRGSRGDDWWSVGVFLGYDINEKSPNPYAPSAVKLRFVVNDSRRIIQLPASRKEDVTNIEIAGNLVNPQDVRRAYENWDKNQGFSAREKRLFVTGNILQGMRVVHDFKVTPQLVSFTTKDGQVKRGLMLPRHSVLSQEDNEVVAPIQRAKKFLLSLRPGATIETADGVMAIQKELYGDNFRLYVPKSKAKGGDYYLDPDLRNLVIGHDFDSKGDKMVAKITEDNMPKVIELLGEKFHESIMVKKNQVDASDAPETTFGFGLGVPIEHAAEQVSEFLRNMIQYAVAERQNENIDVPDSEVLSALKKGYWTTREGMKMLSLPMWLAEKYPGFGDTWMNGHKIDEGIWGTIDRIGYREFNENLSTIQIDILHEFKDAAKLNQLQWNQILHAAEELQMRPTMKDLTDNELEVKFGITGPALKVWKQYRMAYDVALDFKKQRDRYQIIHGEFDPKAKDLKKYLTQEALEEAGLDDYASEQIMAVVDQPVPNINRVQVQAIWSTPEVREIVADGVVDDKYIKPYEYSAMQSQLLEAESEVKDNPDDTAAKQRFERLKLRVQDAHPTLLTNFFTMSRPENDRYAVTASEPPTMLTGPEEEEVKPYRATFDTRAKAVAHANEIERQGYGPPADHDKIQVFEIKDEKDKKKLRTLGEDYLLDLADERGIENPNPTIDALIKEIKARTPFQRYFIERERVPGFQWTKENLEKNVTSYVTRSLRSYHKYVANVEARNKLRQMRSKSPAHVTKYAQQWLDNFQNADPMEWQVLRQLIYNHSLFLSVWNGIQNLSQTITHTQNEIATELKKAGSKTPFLTEKVLTEAAAMAAVFDAVKAGKKVGNLFHVDEDGQETRITTPVIPPAWSEVLERLRRQGVVSPLALQMIAGLSADPQRKYPRGGKVRRAGKRFLYGTTQLGSVIQRVTEVGNRDIAAMSAMIIGSRHFNLQGQDLMEYVVRFINRTQFPYAKHNMPMALGAIQGNRIDQRALRNTLALGMILRSYYWNTYHRTFNVSRHPIKNWPGFWRMWAAYFATSGLRGMVPWGTILLPIVAMLFVSGDDSYEEKERKILKPFEKTFGLPDRTLTTGPLGAVAGVETSRSIGIADFMGAGTIGDIMGYISTLPSQQQRALRDIGDGDVLKGFEQLITTPRFISNLIRAHREASRGLFVGGRRRIAPENITPADATKRSLGMTPTKFYNIYDEISAMRAARQSRTFEEVRDKELFATALAEGDEKMAEDVMVRLGNYNEEHPTTMISPATLYVYAMQKGLMNLPSMDQFFLREMQLKQLFESEADQPAEEDVIQ